MQKLDPNDIVNIISLVSNIFSEKRSFTKEEDNKINTFFTIYMGKAMEECQDASKKLWTPQFPKSELCFSSKTVLVAPKIEEGAETRGKIEFIIATTRGVFFNQKDLEAFQKNSQDKIIEEFSDKDTHEWTMVFNKLLFGKDKTVNSKSFINGLFLGIRFDKSFFVKETKH